MRANNKTHMVDWYDRALCNLNNLRNTLNSPSITKEAKLTKIREQYATLSYIDLVCDGEAFFLGVPRTREAADDKL